MENQANREEIKPAPRRKWKRWVCLAALLIIGPTQYLNHTGFCYAEMRYLNERELVDRFLFKDKARHMTFDEKVAYMKEQRSGTDYPNCCRLFDVDRPTLDDLESDDLDYRLLRTILGKYLYKVEIYTNQAAYSARKLTPNSNVHPYKIHAVAVDQCGRTHWGLDSYDLTENVYRKKLMTSKEYWDQVK